jgi:AcrR family transcriptional regulator
VTRATAQADQRRTIIELAAHVIASEGEAKLTARRLADDAGTSTMAIYTHFGGMDGVRHAVRREGFARLTNRLQQLTETKDPVADLALLGLVYVDHATVEPDLYRVMFIEPLQDRVDAEIGWDTFAALVQGVERCIAARRFTRGGEAETLARQLWALAHGSVSLHLAGLLTRDAAIELLGGAAFHLFTGYGDTPKSAQDSLGTALTRASRA